MSLSEPASWWVNVCREDWDRAQKAHQAQMADSRFGKNGTVYASLGDAVPRPKSADAEFAPRPRFEV